MDKKQFNRELEAFVKENPEAGKQEITAHMVVQGASAAMCMRELTNKQLSELGVKIEPRGTDLATVELRKDVGKVDLDSISTYEQLVEAAEGIVNAHPDFDVDRAIKEIRKYAKGEEVQLPKKSNLGDAKKAIINFFTEADLATTTTQELADYLWDNTKIDDREKADRMAYQNFGFAKALVEAGMNR